MICDKLKINYRKSSVMIVSIKANMPSNFSVSINQNLIEKANSVKYLGVYIDDKLSWKIHITTGSGPNYKSKLELKSKSEILPVNCRFICNSIPT